MREPNDLKSELRRAFRRQQPIIGICASGILIRILAPLLSDKQREPPVIALAEDGSAAVPLLGGHHGANDLARRIADHTGGVAAITTASELHFGTSLDKPEGYRLSNPQHLKNVAARLISGEKLRVKGEAPWLSALPRATDASLGLLVTEYAVPGNEASLVYHPQTLALGVGCERGVSPDELINNVEGILLREGLAAKAIACIATIDLKADEQAVNELGRKLGLPVRYFSAAELNEETPRLKNPSEAVFREIGCKGVAEAAALRAAGAQGELIVEKTPSAKTTCAVARAPCPIAAEHVGRPRGRLSIVGLGPGSEEWRSPAAEVALLRSCHWVGYSRYLELAADLRVSQTEHRFPLGEEETRARHALDLAGEGHDVALLCSGDAGIYAMAALVYQLLDPNSASGLADDARRISVDVIPGISAFQAAAARAGAVIGHDFCAISLSDLLTPWDVIERRLSAAAEGDFVVALYNPRSCARVDQLDRAMAILRAGRPADTPVIVASNLGRPGEHLDVRRIDAFDTSRIDMLTIVLVGSTSTRSFRRGDGATIVYTPRGYSASRNSDA
ncbi:MAG TPA: precorrin-3B C(17)-methyltransferase [Aestuariivirgaceae bacterium]